MDAQAENELKKVYIPFAVQCNVKRDSIRKSAMRLIYPPADREKATGVTKMPHPLLFFRSHTNYIAKEERRWSERTPGLTKGIAWNGLKQLPFPTGLIFTYLSMKKSD